MLKLLVAAIQACSAADKPYYYEEKDDSTRCVSREECEQIGYIYEEDG